MAENDGAAAVNWVARNTFLTVVAAGLIASAAVGQYQLSDLKKDVDALQDEPPAHVHDDVLKRLDDMRRESREDIRELKQLVERLVFPSTRGPQ